jgi:hypothetical protein
MAVQRHQHGGAHMLSFTSPFSLLVKFLISANPFSEVFSLIET